MNKLRTSSQAKMAVWEAREELSPYLKRLDLEKLSKHNRGYLRYADDPVVRFVDAEMHAHIRIVEFLSKSLPTEAKIIDIGFFIPVVPIALAKLGFHVSSIENLAFYDSALDDIISLAARLYNIEVYDLDILCDDIDTMADRFDAVILSAILEHLNGTPKHLLNRAKTLGKKKAYYIVGVPNVAAIYKRFAFFAKGLPPFPPISDYYHSDYPFTGHNREYTIHDLRYVLEQSGFDIVMLDTYSRSIASNLSFKARLLHIVAQLGPESLRESIWAVARKC